MSQLRANVLRGIKALGVYGTYHFRLILGLLHQFASCYGLDMEDANKLAEKINLCIQDVCAKQYSRMSQACRKELWAAVKATNGTHRRTEKPSYLLRDVERVNDYFAAVCNDPSSSAIRGICSNRSLCNPQNSTIVLQPYEVERLLSKMKASSPSLITSHTGFFVHARMKLLILLQIF